MKAHIITQALAHQKQTLTRGKACKQTAVLNTNLKSVCSFAAMLSMLRDREKKGGVKPDADLDSFMKAQATEGKNGSVNTELVLRLLGLQV